MSEIEKIQRYIERTRMSEKTAHSYAIGSAEIGVFLNELERDWFGTICTIYNYGRAKGYRASKAEKKVRAAAV